MNPNLKKAFLAVVVVIVVAILITLGFKYKNIFSSTATTTPMAEEDDSQTDIGGIQIKPGSLGQTLPLSNDPKDVAWAVFQKYLAYNKNLDLESVKSVVYKVASVCEDPKTTIDCQSRMNSAYQFGNALKKEDFVNIWSDKNQTILSTDFHVEEDDVSIGRFRSIIFFIKDESGNFKLLSFSPFKGAAASKDTTASRKEIDDRLVTYTEDNDQDGIADYDEECLAVKEGQTCVKTNQKLRDTNGDGLWDGVEALMK
jgi:hypothetical protein